MARSKSSGRWLKEHFDDPFVKMAQEQGYRSRATFKLLEIDKKDHLLKPGVSVLDLGAAPGGWSQVAAEKVGPQGKVIASDILPMDSLPDVQFIQGDFREDSVFDSIMASFDKPIDLVISDMAPNMSGNAAVDIPSAMYLVELAADIATRLLRPGGQFLVKVFQGEGFEEFLKQLKADYQSVVTRKPEASRGRSRELYLLGRGFKG